MSVDKISRKKEREIIILSLYSVSLSGNDIFDTVHYVLEQNKIESKATDYIINSIMGVQEHVEIIDKKISDNLENYRIDRLSYIDLAIIRFATYELMYANDTPSAIIINEAIELTKKYSDIGDNKASAFNNKLLETIKEDTR